MRRRLGTGSSVLPGVVPAALGVSAGVAAMLPAALPAEPQGRASASSWARACCGVSRLNAEGRTLLCRGSSLMGWSSLAAACAVAGTADAVAAGSSRGCTPSAPTSGADVVAAAASVFCVLLSAAGFCLAGEGGVVAAKVAPQTGSSAGISMSMSEGGEYRWSMAPTGDKGGGLWGEAGVNAGSSCVRAS